MDGKVKERPLLVVDDAQAIVDEADIDGVAARGHQPAWKRAGSSGC
jgi:hypothetical protein